MKVWRTKRRRRLLEFRGRAAAVDEPLICIQMPLGRINRRPAARFTDLLLLLRFSRGVPPHRGGSVAGADPSGASPPAVQPAEAGPPAASPHRGQARPPHEVNRDPLAAVCITAREPRPRVRNRPVAPAARVYNCSLAACRYALLSHGDTVELRLDLLFLVQRLQAALELKGGHPSGGVWKVTQASRTESGGGGGALDLGLALDCHRDGAKVGCEACGVQLTQTPFMVVHY